MVLYFFTETPPRRFSNHPLPPPNRLPRHPPPPSLNHTPPPPRLHLSPSLPPPPLPLLRAEATTGQETADLGGKLLRSSSSGAGGARAEAAAGTLARGSDAQLQLWREVAREGGRGCCSWGAGARGGPDLAVLNLGPQRNSRSGWCARWQPTRGPRGGGRRSRRHASPWQ